MLLIFTFVGSLLLVQSSSNVTDSYDLFNLSTTDSLEFTKPSFVIEISATVPSTQESNYLNNTPQESTSWNSNSLIFKPKESLIVSPTNATTTDAQIVINTSLNFSDPEPFAIEKNASEVVSTAMYVTQSEVLPVPQEEVSSITLKEVSEVSSVSTKVRSEVSSVLPNVKPEVSSVSPNVKPEVSSASHREEPKTSSVLIEEELTTLLQFPSTHGSVQVIQPTYLNTLVPGNVTAVEEAAEQNAIGTTELKNANKEKNPDFVVGRKCTRLFQDSFLWNETEGGMLALKSCPSGYQGNMYRPCFTSGKWGKVDFSECRLEHLGRMRHMILHQVQKGMMGNMYILVDEFSRYISSVDMKSPMDRLEAFEILNTFLKLDMNLKLDKSKDTKYIQTLLHASNELIRKKTVSFAPGSQKNLLITQKVVEMIHHLTSLAERALRGLLKTQKKHIILKSTPNVAMYLYRGKLSGQLALANISDEHYGAESPYSSLENTLERSAYALVGIKGLRDILSTNKYLVNSDVGVTAIVSPLNSLSHMPHPPTYDVGFQMEKDIPEGYVLRCGQLWNTSHLWNVNDCSVFSVKGDLVICRCRNLGSIALLLEEIGVSRRLASESPMGTMITISCISSLCLIFFTFVVNFLLKKGEHNLSVFILINILVCMGAIQLFFLFGVNSAAHFEICMSIALFLHYLFLVLCFWVVSYGFYLLRRLRSSAEYIGNFRDYCAVCWICPLLLLIISFVANPEGYEARQYCWLNIRRGIFWSFVLPVTGLIMVNTFIMIASLKTFNEQMSMTHRTEIYRIRNSLRAGITLLPVFAINWFFGLLAVEDSMNVGLQIIFSLTNSIQGIMTFIFFCIMDNNIQLTFRLKLAVVSKKPKVSAMKLKKSGSFPIFERPLLSLSEDSRRTDCTPLLANRMSYHDSIEDPCCSNIRV